MRHDPDAGTGERRDTTVPGSLGCARCGACCEDISISTNMTDVLASMSGNGGAGTSPPWHWEDEPEGALPRRAKYGIRVGGQAREAAFLLRHWRPTGEVRREGDAVKQVLACDMFDPVHRVCTAGNERPRVCSDYPFYGGPPRDNMRDLRCSYWLDVPPAERREGARPLIPLEVIHR